VTDIRDELGQSVCSTLVEAGHEAEYRRLDVRRASDWEAATAACVDCFGAPNVLVNNAFVGRVEGLLEETLEGWNSVIEVILTGAFLGMRAVIPIMREHGGGSIVNIGSTFGIVGAPDVAAYHAAKGGVLGLTKNAAVSFAADGIRVNAVHPGPMSTPVIAEAGAGEVQAIAARTTLLNRVADPNEVAPAIVFLASDESSFVTGADFMIDGGVTAH